MKKSQFVPVIFEPPSVANAVRVRDFISGSGTTVSGKMVMLTVYAFFLSVIVSNYQLTVVSGVQVLYFFLNRKELIAQ
jgi:hypothetical protein